MAVLDEKRMVAALLEFHDDVEETRLLALEAAEGIKVSRDDVLVDLLLLPGHPHAQDLLDLDCARECE